MKNKIIKYSISNPIKTIIISLLCTCFIGQGLRWIIIDDDLMKIMPDNIPSMIAWNKVIDEFGNTDFMFIAFGEKGKNILSANSFATLWDITKALENTPGVEEVMTISNINRIDNIDDFMEVSSLQEKRGLTNLEIESITSYLNKNTNIANRFFNDSFEFTNILVRPAVNINYAEFVNSILPISNNILEDYEVHYSGVPYTTGLVPELIQSDVSSLMKFGMLIMVLILLLNLRNIFAVGMVISVIFLSLISMLGFMGWVVLLTGSSKFYFTLLNSSMPIILLTIANSDGVHIITKFYREFRKDNEVKKAVYRTMDAMMFPIFLTSLTTTVAFFTLIWAPLNPLTGYGISIGFGIVWAWILSSTFLPALITLKKWNINSKGIMSKSILENIIHWFGKLIIKYPKIILGSGLIIVLIGCYGVTQVKVNINFKTFFKPDTEIFQSMDFIDNEMSGSLNMVVRVEDEIKDPKILHTMEEIQEFVELNPNVTLSISMADIIKQMHRVVMDDKPEFEFIPNNRDKINNLFTMYSMSGDQDDFNSLVDYNYEVGLITILMKSVSTDQIYEFVQKLEKYINYNINDDIQLTITGMLVVFRDFVNLIVKSSLINILSAIFIIYIIAWFFYKSPIWAALSIIPLTSAVILNFGFMGIFGVELSHVTAILSSIIIGVGVDFAVHYIAQYKKYSVDGIGLDNISKEVLDDVGYPIILDASSNMAFGALLFSSFVPVQYIGGLMVFAMLSTSIGTLTLLATFSEIFKKFLYSN